jgi:hypothetical protein
VEASVASLNGSTPQTGRIMLIGGVDAGESSRVGAQQRKAATAILVKWRSAAMPQ